MLGRARPCHGCRVDFFQRVNNICVMQGDIGGAKRGAKTSVKSGVPLLIFVAKPNDREVTLFNQGFGANGIDLGGFVIAPKIIILSAQNISGRITGWMVGYRGGEGNLQIMAGAALFDLLAPICMNFAGKINCQSHGRSPVFCRAYCCT